MRVQIPPVVKAERARRSPPMRLRWVSDTSAPAAIMNCRTTPALKRVPRIRKLSAGHSPRSFTPRLLAQPVAVRLESAGGQHARAGLDALARSENAATKRPVVQFESIHR